MDQVKPAAAQSIDWIVAYWFGAERPDDDDGGTYGIHEWITQASSQAQARDAAERLLPEHAPCEGDELHLIFCRPSPTIVGWYNVDRCYGGPEEGGWWYDRSSPCTDGDYTDLLYAGLPIEVILPRIFATEEAALAYVNETREAWQGAANAGRRDISSVLSDGVYRIYANRGLMQQPEPATRPRYE